jgi:Flp pilus assembly protein TadG
MLADIEMTILAVFLFLMFAFGGVEMMNMSLAEYSVQDEAQAVAMSAGHFGGYTSAEESAVNQYITDFCENQGLDPAGARVDVQTADGPAPWPAPYGTNVTATIDVPYNFEIGSIIIPITVDLRGYGRSVSSYIDGMTPDVGYVSQSGGA